MRRWQKWGIVTGIIVLLIALGIWWRSAISMYFSLQQQPQIETAQLQALWDEYQSTFQPQPPPDQNRFLITTKITEELSPIIEDWKQNPTTYDLWLDIQGSPMPKQPPTSGPQVLSKFVAEESLLSQVRPLLDRYVTASALPNGIPQPSTFEKPTDTAVIFKVLDLSYLALLQCNHFFLTNDTSKIWPLLNANLQIAADLTSHPSTLLDYAAGSRLRDTTLTWLGHALQAQPTLVASDTIRNVIDTARQKRASLRQALLAEMAYAIAIAPDVLQKPDNSDPSVQLIHKSVLSGILQTIDHPDAPCTPETSRIIDPCKIRDRFQKATQEDDTTLMGIALVLDILRDHQQTGSWPATPTGMPSQTFTYSFDQNGFTLKTTEEIPRDISAPLEMMEPAVATTPTPSPPPATGR